MTPMAEIPGHFGNAPETSTAKSPESKENQSRKPIDALIVFGASINSNHKLEQMDRLNEELIQSPEASARIRLTLAAKLRVVATAELILSGQVEDIILTGGKTQEKNGVPESEAELMKTYLKVILKKRWRSEEIKVARETGQEIGDDLDVRLEDRWRELESHVILEDQALSTMQNFSYAVNYLDANKTKYQHLAFLSNGFHIPRIMEIANKYQMDGSAFAAEELAAHRNRGYEALSRNYFDVKGNSKFRKEVLNFDPDSNDGFTMGILMAVQEAEKAERQRNVVEARIGSSMEEAEKIERYNRRAIAKVPEFWLPDVVHIADLDRLKSIISKDEVREVIESQGVDDVANAFAEELRDALSGLKKKSPPRGWREEDYPYEEDRI